MPTLKDVAKKAGLSVTQVSRALNNHSDVNADTRERVHAIARSLNYQPNLSARKLVSGRSGLIGLVTPHSQDLENDGFFIEVIAGLSTQFSVREMQLVLHIAEKNAEILPVYQRLIGNGALDGFVLLMPMEDDERIRFLTSANVPFVVHGRSGTQQNYPYFDIDNEGIFHEITSYLLSLGHRNIAFLNGPAGRGFVEARSRGYLSALSKTGIDPAKGNIRNQNMSEAYGLVATIDLFAGKEDQPTAIICSHTRIAKGVYRALNALGLAVPDDVSVMAHDDHVADIQTAGFYPALSVTDAPLRNSWGPLAECLADAISGAPLSQVQRTGEHQIHIRQSTSQPKEK